MVRDERDGDGGRLVARADAPRAQEVPAVVSEHDDDHRQDDLRSDDDRSATSRPSRPPTDEPRIGDRERQVVVDRLREAVGSGHLTLDEFAERVEDAWRAVVPSELAPLVQDLPGGVPPSVPSAPSTATSTTTATSRPAASQPAGALPRARSSVIGVMSGATTRGRWRVAREVKACAFWGSACVDLRDALFDGPVVDIQAKAIMGGVSVIVPEGIPVEMDGWVLMGGTSNRAKLDGILPGAPLVRVHACGLWGGVEVRTKARRGTRDHQDLHVPGVPAVPSVPSIDVRTGVPAPPTLFTPPPPPATPTPPTPPATATRTGGASHRPDGRQNGRSNGRRHSSHDSHASNGSNGSNGSNDLPEGTLTIMFTDIVDSTAVVESVGDQRWSEVVAEHDRIVRAVVAARGGTTVKGNGDGHLVVFPSARQAVLAGIEVRDAAAVDLRVGLHTGEVVRQDGDVYGLNVIAASRITGAAEPGQVVVSALTKDLVESSGDLAFSTGRTVDLKGLAQPWRIHEARLVVVAT